MRRIDVPYLLNYQDEERIYRQGLQEASRTRHVAPHTTALAALWAVLTRLVRSGLSDAEDLTLSERQAVKALTPVDKALLFAGEIPRTLPRETREALSRELVRKLRNEYPQEGMEGISPRIVQNIFADICETGDLRCVTPVEFFRKLKWMLEEGTELREHLTQEVDGEYGDPSRHLQAVIERYEGIVKGEVESALIDVAPQELDAKIRSYLQHVTAHLKREKLAGPHGRPVDPDEALMRFVESKMGVEDDAREEFRFKTLARATEAVKDGATLDIAETYKDLYRSVLQGLYEERRRRIHWPSLRLALGKIDDPVEFAKLDEWTRRVAETLTRNMRDRYGYCVHCSKAATFYALDHQLIETENR
jgi:serine protein kinase